MRSVIRAASQQVLHQRFLPADGNRAHVWKFSWEHGGRRPRHFHAEPELNLIIAGTATFGIGDAVVRVSAGEMLEFPPGQDHVLLETSPDIRLFALGLAAGYSEEVLRASREIVAIPAHVRLAAAEFQSLVKSAESLVDRSGIDRQGAELWEHAHWARQKSAVNLRSGVHVLTRRTLALVAEAPQINRDVLAGKLRAAPTAISRYFHQDTGITLVKYRTRLRLLRFIEQLDSGSKNLATLAKAAGFGSYSQCHRAFSSELGCSPRDFFFSGVRQSMQREYESP
jgi:AraC-like DNA-binding protein/quercetin dioxygenase-like cupin family protein